jgi:anaplastic lymphoma kinase
VNKAIALMIAGGGGGLGIGRYLDDEIQQARGFVPERQDTSGQVLVDDIVPAGPGGGWRGRQESALDPHFGASLLEGARGGVACYQTAGKHGFGGFGGGKRLRH